MPMGIVSDSDFDLESEKLGQRKSEQKAEIVDSPIKGRGEGNIEVPNGLRNIIGETAITDGRTEALDLAKRFGISPSSVSAYTNGSTSTSSYEDRKNEDVILKTKDKISKRARMKLMAALRHITDEKLGEAKVGEIASVARHMSAVVKDLEPDIPSNGNPGNNAPTFVFYSPQFRKEEHFDIVPSKE